MSNPPNPVSWDDRYAGEEFFYGRDPNDFLKEQAGRIVPGGSVLCLAEGEGRNAVYLAGKHFSVTAVDGSKVGLEKLQRFATERHVKIQSVVSDLANYDMGEEKWDAIVSIWCHLPPVLRADVHSRAVKALKPGGLFVLEAYNPRQLEFKTGGPPNVEMLMTLDGLRQELAGLEIQHGTEIIRDIHEGKGHEGKSAVVQVAARKVT
jgi:SAM-dependent methyltransferase